MELLMDLEMDSQLVVYLGRCLDVMRDSDWVVVMDDCSVDY